MKPYHRLCCAIMLASAFCGSRLEAQSPGRYRYSRPIERAAPRQEDIVAFELDSDIYAATRPGLPDLRVVDDTPAEVPYQVESEMEQRQERSRTIVDTQVVSLQPDGQKLEVHVKLPDKAPQADALILATPLMNYERAVHVEGSTDGAAWKTLVAKAIIFDYSRFMDVSRRDIALPANDARHFKLTIDDVVDQRESPLQELTKTFREGKESERVERTTIERRPFRIDRIWAASTQVRARVAQARLVPYPIAKFETKEDAAAKQTIVTIATHRQPLTAFSVVTPARNFSRKVAVQAARGQADKVQWQTLAEGRLSNLSFRDQHEQELSVAFPESREQAYRLVIANDDNPPLQITGIEARGVAQRVVFLAQAGRQYRVNYGSASADAPRYESATVLARLAHPPVLAALGPPVEDSSFKEAPGVRLLDNWYFLGAAIVLMVCVLAWCLLRAGTKLDQLPKE